ncbi:UPF0496 protein At5g66670-like [Raphanus sativus]|uniref:UPF0496 protein At5g66670-like n=1 Tax=Raphanus sativus TaxID=3726 RepID=A0A9W3CHF4_RAPSA|nr:UPF0496 protein At5g66670-like [Raphanus sativus]
MPPVGFFAELLLKYSGCVSSKRSGTSTSPFKPFLTDKLPNYAENYVNSYSENVAKFIIDSKEDVLKNEELKSLVDLYYEELKTLNLFNTVDKCVKKAEITVLNIRVAIKKFEKESMDMDLGGNKNYADTLKELNKLRLLEKFPELQVELDKKQKDVKKRRKLATIVFGAAFFSFSVLSMYLCIVVAPPVVVAVALGLTKTVGTAGIWVYGMMKDYEEALESKIDLLRLTENIQRATLKR